MASAESGNAAVPPKECKTTTTDIISDQETTIEEETQIETTISVIANDHGNIVTAVAEDPISTKHGVTWADGKPHIRNPDGSTFSTQISTAETHCGISSSNNNRNNNEEVLPLRSIFSEEGSSVAAVMDENIMSVSKTLRPHTSASTSNNVKINRLVGGEPGAASLKEVRDFVSCGDNIGKTPNNRNSSGNNSSNATRSSESCREELAVETSRAAAQKTAVTTVAMTTMATNVVAGRNPLSVAVIVPEESDVEENRDDALFDTAAQLSQSMSKDSDYSNAVVLSPAFSESTSERERDHQDHVFVSPSMSSSEDSDACGSGDVGGVVPYSPSSMMSDDVSNGIILPPSFSGLSTLSNQTGNNSAAASDDGGEIPVNTATCIYHITASSEAASQLLSLPIDSMHCVASFLTPLEWAQFGQTCSAAGKVCREVFRRVRMHGFKCATEVVTAWKLDQLADAKELAALYISAGVPIYPYSLGHSYHTICWRMGIEAKNMQEKLHADNANASATERANNNRDDASAATPAPVDRFYSERSLRGRDGNNDLCSYLEDKSMFILGPTHGNNNMSLSGGRWNSMASLQAAHREQPLVPPAVAAAANPLAQPQPHAAGRLPDFHPSASPTHSRSLSQSELMAKCKAPKVLLPIHRHLLDQHLIGRSMVDDENGEMKTPPFSLSADFFHPHLASHSISSHSRPLMQQTPPSTPTGAEDPPATAAAATTTTAASDENLLEDPSFQAWAVRAAATVHNRLGGAPLEDAEELAELQELYSQIFAGERNTSLHPAPAPAAEGGNNLENNPMHAHVAVHPPRELPSGSPPNALAAASLEESLLSTVLPRQGYSSILKYVDLEVYSASKANLKDTKAGDLKSQLKARFTFYQRRLEVLLSHSDSYGYEECMLDFWDEFFPLTAKIHYYDRQTPVPRISSLRQFLTQPCPKEIGIVQCEIERVRISSKKRKGVSMKGRLFPTYEYRLFIKDREHTRNKEGADDSFDEDIGTRRDTVLMVAKNRGRKHVDTSGVLSLTPSAKKGANNYYLYTPQQVDVDTHFNNVNETEAETNGNCNGVSLSAPAAPATTPPVFLGRLQSNFIGTEFQIYTPKLRKNPPDKPIRRCASLNEAATSCDDDPEYESGVSSDTGSSGRRRSRFGRLTLRRSSSHASSPTNSDQASQKGKRSRSRSRTRSRQDNAGVRPTRMNRRAIANSMEPSPSGDSLSPLSQQPVLCEEEDGVITYTANLLGSRPRIMDVCIPKISADGNVGAVWRKHLENCVDSEDCAPYNRMLHCFKQLQQRLEGRDGNDNEGDDQNEDNEGDISDDFGLLALQNRPPWWNIELGSFVLNFRGRVSVASVKNFQLCDRNDHDHIMLQFGRIQGRHSFTMDYQYPLTAVQAFSIAISSLQSKISFG